MADYIKQDGEAPFGVLLLGNGKHNINVILDIRKLVENPLYNILPLYIPVLLKRAAVTEH